MWPLKFEEFSLSSNILTWRQLRCSFLASSTIRVVKWPLKIHIYKGLDLKWHILVKIKKQAKKGKNSLSTLDYEECQAIFDILSKEPKPSKKSGLMKRTLYKKENIHNNKRTFSGEEAFPFEACEHENYLNMSEPRATEKYINVNQEIKKNLWDTERKRLDLKTANSSPIKKKMKLRLSHLDKENFDLLKGIKR